MLKPLITALVLLSSQAFATPINLIQNGDFSQIHTASQGGKTNFGIPDFWNGITGQIDNATVLQGAMMFSTSGPRDPIYDKFYIYQSVNIATAGFYTLTFDYLLKGASTGSSYNGAKVFLDVIAASAPGITPVQVPNMIFGRTYSQEYSDILRAGLAANLWHLGQTVRLNLTAGNHLLFLSSGAMDLARSQASVWYDNVSLVAEQTTAAVPAPATAWLLLPALCALGWRRRSSANA